MQRNTVLVISAAAVFLVFVLLHRDKQFAPPAGSSLPPPPPPSPQGGSSSFASDPFHALAAKLTQDLSVLSKVMEPLKDEVQGMSKAVSALNDQQTELTKTLVAVKADVDQLKRNPKPLAASASASTQPPPAAAVASTSVVGSNGKPKSKIVKTAGHWVVETSERVREKFGEMPALPSGPNDIACNGQATCFFGRCFCEPGWSGADCDQKLIPANPWYTDCPELDPANKGTTPCPPKTIYFEYFNECPFLCGYHADSGVARTSKKRWQAAQKAEAGIWSGAGDSGDRQGEHMEGFGQFRALRGGDFFFGDIIEFGCGPWTQSRYMLQHLGLPASVQSVTLLEPNGARYIREVPGSAYRNGVLNDKYPVTMVSVGGEGFEDGWRFVEMFDTVVSINVVEHVLDGFRYLENLWLALKPGGTLIFHDRWFDDPIKAAQVLGSFALHPIRLNRNVMGHFLNQFEPLFNSTEQTDRMRNGRATMSHADDPTQRISVPTEERGYYFIGRKPLTATTDHCKIKP